MYGVVTPGQGIGHVFVNLGNVGRILGEHVKALGRRNQVVGDFSVPVRFGRNQDERVGSEKVARLGNGGGFSGFFLLFPWAGGGGRAGLDLIPQAGDFLSQARNRVRQSLYPSLELIELEENHEEKYGYGQVHEEPQPEKSLSALSRHKHLRKEVPLRVGESGTAEPIPAYEAVYNSTPRGAGRHRRRHRAAEQEPGTFPARNHRKTVVQWRR